MCEMGCAGRVVLACCALALASGCPREHDPSRIEVDLADCVTCHLDEFQLTEAPPHVDRLPQTCADCHTTEAWVPSTFTHDRLTTACVTCHEYDYQNTQDPRHPGQYPQTCGDCHMTTAWRPALEGMHPNSRFPITSGAHEHIGCIDCHDPMLGSSVGGANTDCIGCHTGKHSRAKMDEEHHEVGGYSWDASRPSFCLDCHPNGRK